MYIKRVRIINKRRFLLVVAIVALIVLRLSFTAFAFADKKIKALADKREEEFLKMFSEVEVVFGVGDTAWRIQEQLAPDEDVRVLLGYVKELNKGVDWGNIRPGDSLIFLEKKEKD